VLVVDASIAVYLALRPGPLPIPSTEHLVAPALLWSESASALHELAFRGDIDAALAEQAIARLTDLGIERHADPGLYADASRIARQLGWAKTYDAEYVALALRIGGRLLTRDRRLERGASRLISVLGPADLHSA
jgi:predicted nucleic acid-binding protein